jgi:hypothetical protein
MSGMRQTELQQHLRVSGEHQAVPDQRARTGAISSGWVYRLAKTHLLGRVEQEPVQRLTGAEPVGPAVTGREQHRGDGRRGSLGGQQSDAAAY